MDLNYTSRINRNLQVVINAPGSVRAECTEHLKWAISEMSNLEGLTKVACEERIEKIIQVLDEDYEKMGYILDSKKTSI